MNPVALLVVNRMVDIPAACRSWYAQCTLCSRPWTFTGTVLGMVVMRLLLCNDRCPGWSAQKLWSSAVAVLMVAVQFLDKVVVPVGAMTLGRAILVRLWIHVLHHPGRLLEEFVQFSS